MAAFGHILATSRLRAGRAVAASWPRIGRLTMMFIPRHSIQPSVSSYIFLAMRLEGVPRAT
jgi:hypothetical protein